MSNVPLLHQTIQKSRTRAIKRSSVSIAEQLTRGIEFIEACKKETIDNFEHWKCKTCKLDIPYHSWGAHLKKHSEQAESEATAN